MSGKRIQATIKNNKWFITAVFVLSVFICINCFYIYRACVFRSIDKELATEWKIPLPKERIIKYAAQSVYPDGHDTYIVYKVKELPWGFHGYQARFMQAMMDEIITAVQNGGWLAPQNKIPEKYMPDWSEGCYFGYYAPVLEFGHFSSGYCMAYFSESNLLLVCERVSA